MTSTLSLVYSWFLWQFQFQNWPDQSLPNLRSNWILMQIIYTVWQWLSIRFLDACSGEKIIFIFTEKNNIILILNIFFSREIENSSVFGLSSLG